MLTLWEQLGSWFKPLVAAVRDRPARPAARRARPKPPPAAAPPEPSLFDVAKPATASKRGPAPAVVEPKPAADQDDEAAQARYDRVTRAMLTQYQVRVRKWRSSMSGIAWEVYYRDGSVQRLIEAPRPKGPMSAAVFLHEIGHHAIGFNTYKPRCLEEYHAWRWSLDAMAAHGLNITDAVRRRMHESLWYAVAKARRRGIKDLPVELLPFVDRPPRTPRTPRTPGIARPVRPRSG